jgi:hypothetical protein
MQRDRFTLEISAVSIDSQRMSRCGALVDKFESFLINQCQRAVTAAPIAAKIAIAPVPSPLSIPRNPREAPRELPDEPE